MLTVLVKYRVSKRECLFPATSVEFSPQRYEDPTALPADLAKYREDIRHHNENVAGLLIFGPDHDRGDQQDMKFLQMTHISEHGAGDFRDVYVMNDKGATIAHYTL